MVLAPCNKGGQGEIEFFRITFHKLIAKLPEFAIINAWQHFGSKKSASHNK